MQIISGFSGFIIWKYFTTAYRVFFVFDLLFFFFVAVSH